MSDLSYFSDRVAGMRADVEAGRVEVRFKREPLVLWIPAAQVDTIHRVADAAEAGGIVDVAWRSATKQIVSVVKK